MPIRSENKQRYPADWPEIRARILRRASNRCEGCNVKNHALGGRTAEGRFLAAQPTGTGNTPSGLEWPRPGDKGWCSRGKHLERLRIIRIVLTVAHLDHTPENCADANLKAWCQRCHNRYDAAMRRAGTKRRRRQLHAIADLFGVAP